MSKRLEDLDFKEVAERTRIEPEFFEALLAKDFKELSKFNVKGFFKILKREYDLDMDAFFAEYEAFFHKDEVKKEEKKKAQSPKHRRREMLKAKSLQMSSSMAKKARLGGCGL